MSGARLRALITRPRHQAGTLAAQLRRRGVGCLVAPLLEIVDQAWDPAVLAGRQAVLLTSPNGAQALAAALAAGAAVPPLVLAVGTATARPLRGAGPMRIEVAPGSDAADLLRLARAHLDPRGGSIVYLSGAEVACDLGAALAASGLVVERRVVYAARAAGRLPPRVTRALRGGAIQLAPFLSARTAGRFAELLAEAGLRDACRGITGIALSPRIADAMRVLPFRAVQVAPRPDLAGLLNGIEAVLERIPAAASA